MAIDVKSDWTHEDVELAETSWDAAQGVENDRDVLFARLARSFVQTVLSGDELEVLAERADRAD